MEQMVITFNEKRYSPLLKKITHPPRALYVKGDIDVLSQPCFAIVGTRKATREGLELAGRIARDLSEAGLVIVSGLAQGIDGAAHKGALEAGGLARPNPPTGGVGGKTIGVLGSSLEERFFFPFIHLRLAKEIIEKGGAVISEYEKDQPALKYNFVARNRIVSGLSLGVLVVEAPMKSGALITAEFAKKQKRLLFAIPGSPFSKNSEGTNVLIKQGAFLVENANDILEILEKEKLFIAKRGNSTSPRSLTYDKMSKEEQDILEALCNGKSDIDKLAQITKVEVAELLSLLIELEIKGLIKNIGGGNYIVNF